MLIHTGTQNIETPRLLLRKFKTQDAEQIFNNWVNNPKNVEYLSWQAHKSLDKTHEILDKWLSEYKSEKYYRWCITLKDTGEVVGGIDIILLLEHVECCEIGYVLSKKYWNLGIMTEALKAVIKYLFDKVNFHRIQSRHDVNNPASGKVMIKSGMKYEGILRESDRTNAGKWCDMAIYSILQNEFS